MAAPAADEAPDAARLAGFFKVLASPSRVRLLWALRVPKRPGELRVPADEDRGGLRVERALSRTTVIEHLDVLAEAKLVRRLGGDAGYVVDQQSLFSLVQDLSRIASIRPVVEVDVETTLPSRQAPAAPPPAGPRLMLVGGPREGQAFALAGAGPWVVGRGAEADVRLDYDPHVSRAQVVLRRGARGAYTAEAVAASTNPARLDFGELAPGAPVPLPPGAVLSVGASRLVFQPG